MYPETKTNGIINAARELLSHQSETELSKPPHERDLKWAASVGDEETLAQLTPRDKDAVYRSNLRYMRKGEFAKVEVIEMYLEAPIEYRLLFDHPNGYNALICAAAAGNLHKMPEHIFTTAGIEIEDGNGNNTAHYAALNGELRTIASCLSHRALNHKNLFGVTPIHCAAYSGTLADIPLELMTVEMLETIDCKNKSPRHYAFLNKTHSEFCEFKSWLRVS